MSDDPDDVWLEGRLAVFHYRRSYSYETGELLKRPAEHGTSREYRRGCRCHDCADAYNDTRRAARARKRGNT